MSEIQYQATIENGEIKTEEGYFFKAGSFEVQSNSNVFSCQFNRLSNGEVIWEVLENSESISGPSLIKNRANLCAVFLPTPGSLESDSIRLVIGSGKLAIYIPGIFIPPIIPPVRSLIFSSDAAFAFSRA